MILRSSGRSGLSRFHAARVGGVLAGGFSLAAVSAVAQVAATPSAAATEQIVITATRTPQKVSDVVAEVTVIDRAMLDRSEGRSLVEVLSQAPGLQFANNGGFGKPSSLFVRGLEARHLLLLVDGVRVGSATVGTPSLDNLPLDVIDRIEIVRGPMTSLYGSSAMGGVIQVFTRRGSPGVHGNARLSAGSRSYGLASAGVSVGEGGFDLAAQVQHQRTRGFSAANPKAQFGSYNPDDDGFRQNAGSVRAGYTFAPGWRIEGLALESRGRTQYDDGPDADARAALRNSLQSLQVAGTVLEGWRTQLSFGRSLDRYDTQASASPFTTLGPLDTVQRQLTWENRVGLPVGEALVLLERLEQDVSRTGDPFEVSDRHIDALALGYSATIGQADLQASLRRDRSSQFGGKTTGAIAAAWRFSEAWRAGGSYGTSFTAPSFNQLYYPGFGNPDLLPEEGRHAELFGQWVGLSQNVRLTAYRHRYDGFISSGPRPDNIPKVSIDGATLAWEGRFDALMLTASVDHVDPVNDTAGSSANGKLLPRRAKQAAKASADYSLGAWQLGASVQAYSHRFDDTANSLRVGGFGVLDLRADWVFARDWTLGLRLNNASGKTYETVYGYNQPGREGFVTLRWAMR